MDDMPFIAVKAYMIENPGTEPSSYPFHRAILIQDLYTVLMKRKPVRNMTLLKSYVLLEQIMAMLSRPDKFKIEYLQSCALYLTDEIVEYIRHHELNSSEVSDEIVNALKTVERGFSFLSRPI